MRSRATSSPGHVGASRGDTSDKKQVRRHIGAIGGTPATIVARESELSGRRARLRLFTSPLTICGLFVSAAVNFMASNLVCIVTSKATLAGSPLLLVWGASHLAAPSWYVAPDCMGSAAGMLYQPSLLAYEFVWWLVLGILSSIGLGTGLHSGIMFLWPFVMTVIVQADACRSTLFSAVYNDPCSLNCVAAANSSDGTLTFWNTYLLLVPAVVSWGAGTALGELPPYFITRAAKRAGSTNTDYEAELMEATKKSDLISKLKVWTINFTEQYGFVGILLLASWPNAAFDMCGMACGWLDMPFWTFFGATLIGKGLFKVTLQAFVCIIVFSQGFWDAVIGLMPSVTMPAAACKAATSLSTECLLVELLNGGRDQMKLKFSLQRRMLPLELLGKSAAIGIDVATLTDKYCAVMSACGERARYGGTYANAAMYAKMSASAMRVLGAYDTDSNGRLTVEELEAAVGFSDGRLSLASIDPGMGGILSLGNLWNALIASLILYFLCSIVEQVALQTQAARDAEELDALKMQPSAGAKAD